MTRARRIFAIALICGLFSVSVWAGVISQQQAQEAASSGAPAPTASNQFAILITTIAGFASLLVTQLFQFLSANRNRKWDLVDRAAAREEQRKRYEDQRVDTYQSAIELSRVSNINRDHLLGELAQNTKISSDAAGKAEAAFIAANNFNEKLEAMRKELLSFQERQSHAAGPKAK